MIFYNFLSNKISFIIVLKDLAVLKRAFKFQLKGED